MEARAPRITTRAYALGMEDIFLFVLVSLGFYTFNRSQSKKKKRSLVNTHAQGKQNIKKSGISKTDMQCLFFMSGAGAVILLILVQLLKLAP